MKFEMQQMKSELLNTLNNNFHERLQEMETKVLGILNSELSNQTTNLTSNFNTTLKNFKEDMNKAFADMYSELEAFNRKINESTESVNNTLTTWKKTVDEKSSELNTTWERGLLALKNETESMSTKLDNKLVAFSKKMNDSTESVNSTLTTWKKTVDEKSSELNTTWERGLLSLKNETKSMSTKLEDKLEAFSKKMNDSTESVNNTLTTWKTTVDEKSSELNTTWERGLLALKTETESMASNLSTELVRKQATFHGELEASMGRVSQELSKLVNTMHNLERKVTASNDSTEGHDQKEPIAQGYLVILYEYPLHIQTIVVGACIVIGWLICSQCNKRGPRRLPLTARRRLGQAPGAYGDMSDDEEWLDENRQVCIVASLDWTLDEVERCVKAAVQERGLANTAVLTLRISGQDDIDGLKRTLQRDTRVICCANSTTRNILLSDTEHDEISYVVKAAEKIVGGSGVMVLLYGHEKSRGIQQLYDSTSFDRTFLNKQTRLHNKALGHLFFSVSKSLNDIQKRRICDWIRGNL
ncbi:PREDICTED: uncharacterized protein LOC109479849 isoform X3 [Branchiostoma belcheri]|uniref:Uncharacterized protein LOC109479849 isoform X3 n=1 Tax=Branchiostoma belcheri TaxID=7741 RepID=A0A6P4Z7P4_BRABE|nr:PREDICTED: uncharacterized protein LOC109479849 isoform X3 [Branchiostoma belcheri]